MEQAAGDHRIWRLLIRRQHGKSDETGWNRSLVRTFQRGRNPAHVLVVCPAWGQKSLPALRRQPFRLYWGPSWPERNEYQLREALGCSENEGSRTLLRLAFDKNIIIARWNLHPPCTVTKNCHSTAPARQYKLEIWNPPPAKSSTRQIALFGDDEETARNPLRSSTKSLALKLKPMPEEWRLRRNLGWTAPSFFEIGKATPVFCDKMYRRRDFHLASKSLQ